MVQTITVGDDVKLLKLGFGAMVNLHGLFYAPSLMCSQGMSVMGDLPDEQVSCVRLGACGSTDTPS